MDFSSLTTTADVERQFRLPQGFTESILRTGRSNFYQELRLPKRKSARGVRVVYVVREPRLSSFHKRLAVELAEMGLVSVHAHCAKGCSVVSNAKLHLGKKALLRADIKDFFGSITASRVHELFVGLGASLEAATALCQLTTFNGALPQGTCCSPIIAEIAARDLDVTLQVLASTKGCTYSRYSDDLTFSGDTLPSSAEVSNALNLHGFEAAPTKWRRQYKGRTQYVTGLCVADADQPRISRRMKRRLRHVIHCIAKAGVEEFFSDLKPTEVCKELACISGWLAYMHGVEPEQAKKLTAKWAEIIDSEECPLCWPNK